VVGGLVPAIVSVFLFRRVECPVRVRVWVRVRIRVRVRVRVSMETIT
jgi:hypothetical protein